jgi:hypothetical protein
MGVTVVTSLANGSNNMAFGERIGQSSWYGLPTYVCFGSSSGAIGGSASEAVRLQERSLFVVHLVGELPKPVEATRHGCQRLAWR